MEQKFKKGDHIQVADDLGSCMSHFRSGCEAIIIGSYADQYGGSNTDSYTIHIKGSGQTSWYEESQLTLIESNRIDLLEQWESEAKTESDQKGDIDWIFKNGSDVLKSTHGASAKTLAGCLGISNLWGANGEGFTYYSNLISVMNIAAPFLIESDKEGFLKVCDTIKTTR